MDELTKTVMMLERMAEIGLTRKAAATILGVPYMTIYKTIKKYGLEEEYNRNGNAKKAHDKRRRCQGCQRWAKL